MDAANNAPLDPTNVARKRKLEELKSFIQSILQTACNGLTADELKLDYSDLHGREMPIAELGFNNFLELIDDVMDVVEVRDIGGESKYFAKSAQRNVPQFEPLID